MKLVAVIRMAIGTGAARISENGDALLGLRTEQRRAGSSGIVKGWLADLQERCRLQGGRNEQTGDDGQAAERGWGVYSIHIYSF